MLNNGGMAMSAAERIDGNHLVKKGFLLSLAGLAGVFLTTALENIGGFFGSIGVAAGMVVVLGYLAGVVILYSRAGVWKFIAALTVKGLLFPWRITRIIVFSWVFFFVWAAISMCLAWLVIMTSLTAPWLILLLARQMA